MIQNPVTKCGGGYCGGYRFCSEIPDPTSRLGYWDKFESTDQQINELIDNVKAEKDFLIEGDFRWKPTVIVSLIPKAHARMCMGPPQDWEKNKDKHLMAEMEESLSRQEAWLQEASSLFLELTQET